MTHFFKSQSLVAQNDKLPIRTQKANPSAPKPRHSRILAEVLDVALQRDTTLTTLMENDPSLRLETALENLPASAKKILRQRLGQGTLDKFISLSKEPDAKVFYHNMNNLMGELEDADDLRFAYRGYVTLAKQQTQFPETKKSAQVRLDVLSGKGPWGAQARFIGNEFFKQSAKDLPMLGAMVLGTGALRLGRFAIANRFAVVSSEAVTELSLAHRALATVGGGVAEIGVFSGAHAGISALLDKPIEGGFVDHLQAAALLLVPMHVGGFAGERLAGFAVKNTAKLEGALAIKNVSTWRKVVYPVSAPLGVIGKIASIPLLQKGVMGFGSQVGMYGGIVFGLSQQDPDFGLHKGWYWNVTLAQSLALLTQRNLAYGAGSLLFGSRVKGFKGVEKAVLGL